MFKPVPNEVDFPQMEERILQWWESDGVRTEYTQKNDAAGERFSFLDGPITANNPMGVHHAWGRTYKDLFQRHRTMHGYEQRYQNGFDCQGLWVEVEVEKELGLNSKREIEEFGVAEFIQKCKERVYKYSGIQTEQSKRLGYWMDWENSYYTMSEENNYTIWHFLKTRHERGLIYRGHDVMPWCSRCGTGLSEHEIVTEGYKELTHTSIYVRLPLCDEEANLLIWTTTPWTLPANVAVAVSPNEIYARVRVDGEIFILAEQAATRIFGQDVEIVERFPGSKLLGRSYTAPFPDLPVRESVTTTIIPWDEVDPEEGTGCVHIAPGCGREDYQLGLEHDLPVLAPIDESGAYLQGYGFLSSLDVHEANPLIVQVLTERGRTLKIEEITHRYPVCWRCGEELVFRLVDEWFIAMDPWREDIMDVTKKIRWIPEFGLERELDWLRNMSDWMISKKRYWGLALPIWICSECREFDVIGGYEELERRAVAGWDEFQGHSPHRPWIDRVEIECPACAGRMRRIRDVGNPWLDAGIVAYSTLHYLTDPSYWEKWFPADFITESFPGQFRNWFYSLLAMSAGLTKRPPFKTVLGHGLVLDENGEEMHKSAGNAIMFEEAAAEMGADVMRWLYISSNPFSNVLFGYGTADDVRRRFVIPLWNVYSFFITYARIDGFNPATAESISPEDRPPLDRWLLARLTSTLKRADAALEDYDAAEAARSLERLTDDLSNWYVRRSRRRFWRKGNEGSESDRRDKLAAYVTLYEALNLLTGALAPFMPFITEEIYQNLVLSVYPDAKRSVHLTDYPEPEEGWADSALENEMAKVRLVASLGRAARNAAGFKVRQPLEAIMVAGPDWDRELDYLILEELNVRRIEPVSDESDFIEYEVKPDYSILGPRFQSDMPKVARAVAKADPVEVAAAVAEERSITLEGFSLAPEELIVRTHNREGYAAATEGGFTVAVSTDLTPELRREGMARDAIRFIQDSRKGAGLEVSDRIRVVYDAEGELSLALQDFGDLIADEVLAPDFISGRPEGEVFETEIDGMKLSISIEKVG
ncbi:MAG: isoleucine--tRNA ligase [Bacillota bacterium]